MSETHTTQKASIISNITHNKNIYYFCLKPGAQCCNSRKEGASCLRPPEGIITDMGLPLGPSMCNWR